MTKIVRLEAENIKRLKAIQIDPKGNVVVVGGKNGQGKSSTLDAIWYALGGAGNMPTEPLRQGEEKGFSRLTLDNGLTVTRRITPTGTTLKVESETGVLKSPQAVLDRMVGSISFDPLAFTRMEPRWQLETLKQLVGVDTSELDAKRDVVFNTRTEVNRRLRELKDQAAAMVEAPPGTPDEEVSVAALMAEMEEIDAEVRAYDQLTRDVASAKEDLDKAIEAVEEARKRVSTAQRNHTTLERRLTKAPKPRDVLEIRERIQKADEVNQAVRNRKQSNEMQSRIRQGMAMAQELTEKLDAFENQKLEMVRKAKFPVKGLSFGEDGVRFNGVPFEQASSAEQTQVSVGMALAMNPELKVLLVRDGSLLDEESFALLTKMAAKADAQVWIETVTTDASKCAVIIEDGAVKE